MLIHTIYASYADDPAGMDLASILDTSRRNNSRHHITGALAFLDGAFLQVLEGEEEPVDRLFHHIERDLRNHSVRLLERKEIPSRMFSRWSMGLLSWDDETTAIFSRFNPGEPIDLYRVQTEGVNNFLRELAGSRNWETVPAGDPPPLRAEA